VRGAQNAHVESFNGRLGDELLSREIFTSLAEAKVLVEQYRLAYNHERPHGALGYRTPAEFAAAAAEPRAPGQVASAPDGATALAVLEKQEINITLEPALS